MYGCCSLTSSRTGSAISRASGMKSARVVFGWPAEQLVDLGVAGKPVVVREQRVAVRLGGGGDLRADRAGGAGLGLDHDRLLEHRFERRGDRPRDEIVGAAGRERVDDGDRRARERRPARSGRCQRADVPMRNVRRRICSPIDELSTDRICDLLSACDFADRLHRRFDAFGVLVPELGESGLVEIGDLVADIVIVFLNCSLLRDLADVGAQFPGRGVRRAFRRKQRRPRGRTRRRSRAPSASARRAARRRASAPKQASARSLPAFICAARGRDR